MFTGIVEGMGRVDKTVDDDGHRRFTITADKVLDGIEIGDSIAVNGVCLTATSVAPGQVEVTAVTETLQRTNLGTVDQTDAVNLERPLPAAGRFDAAAAARLRSVIPLPPEPPRSPGAPRRWCPASWWGPCEDSGRRETEAAP